MLFFSIISTIPANEPQRRADSGTVARLYEQYADMIYRIAYVRTLNESDSQDILQEVFWRYIRAVPSFSDEGHCRAWFIRTAINCSKTLLTSAWRRHTELGAEPADETFSRMERDTEVYHAVMQLAPGLRTVVHLYYYEDCTTSEIAKLTGLSQSAVKSRLMRARDQLRRMLKEDIDV